MHRMSRKYHGQCKDSPVGWLYRFPQTKFACPYLMTSVDMAAGQREIKEESRHCWNGRVDSMGWQSWQTKGTLSFHQCNFWSLCDCPPACQAESIGWKTKKKQKEALTAKASGQTPCPKSLFMNTLDRREWEQGSCGKGTDRREGTRSPDWCNKVTHWHIHQAVMWKGMDDTCFCLPVVTRWGQIRVTLYIIITFIFVKFHICWVIFKSHILLVKVQFC